MTIQKQLSHLSFAAIMLVFAALPALAQTGSIDNQTVVATTTLRKDRVSIPVKESTVAVAPVIAEKKPALSATQFTKFATEPAVINDLKVVEFTSLENPAKAFAETSSKRITFVPSRGPKFPWQ